MEPVISVCMTTYNHGAYLAKAIESVLMQKCSFPYEIVLGEDCSTDNTPSICLEYQKAHPDIIRIITSQSNVGMKQNYRRTIEACRGKYIAICDGDDWWIYDRKLEEQALYLETHEQTGMCFTRSERRDDISRTREIYPAGPGTEDFKSMLFYNPAENCTAMARRELILQYYAEIRPQHRDWKTDDLPMWLWFAARSNIHFIDRISAVHRVLKHSVSHSPEWRKSLGFCDSLLDISLFYDSNLGDGSNRLALLRKKQNQACWVMSYNGSAYDFLRRWWNDCMQDKRLFLNVYPYGLFAKKILYRMWQKRE